MRVVPKAMPGVKEEVKEEHADSDARDSQVSKPPSKEKAEQAKITETERRLRKADEKAEQAEKERRGGARTSDKERKDKKSPRREEKGDKSPKDSSKATRPPPGFKGKAPSSNTQSPFSKALGGPPSVEPSESTVVKARGSAAASGSAGASGSTEASGSRQESSATKRTLHGASFNWGSKRRPSEQERPAEVEPEASDEIMVASHETLGNDIKWQIADWVKEEDIAKGLMQACVTQNMASFSVLRSKVWHCNLSNVSVLQPLNTFALTPSMKLDSSSAGVSIIIVCLESKFMCLGTIELLLVST